RSCRKQPSLRRRGRDRWSATSGISARPASPAPPGPRSGPEWPPVLSPPRRVQAAEADLDGATFYPGTVKHVLETHTGPDRVAHRTICPLSAGNAWNGVDARRTGALVDRGGIESRQALQNILERQRKGLVDLAPHRQTKAIHIDVARKSCPVPTDIMLVVRG